MGMLGAWPEARACGPPSMGSLTVPSYSKTPAPMGMTPLPLFMVYGWPHCTPHGAETWQGPEYVFSSQSIRSQP